MRVDNIHPMSPPQDVSKMCAECGKNVALYERGVEKLKWVPETRIICLACARRLFDVSEI
jgi:hypothetical protein